MNLNALLGDFNPITLKEMDHVKLMDRVDTKFAFHKDLLPYILEQITPYYSALTIENKRFASYHSIYYDSSEYDFFNDHHRGKMSRFKVRKRKYLDSDLSFLEIKHKYKGRTNKSRIKIESIEEQLSVNEKNYVDGIIKENKILKASLENNFKRITLVGKELHERLTLDVDVQFTWNGETHEMDNLIIAELKQERTNRDSPFFKVMRNLQIRPYRLSKYCMGTMKIHKNVALKSNRFKKKILTINKINTNA